MSKITISQLTEDRPHYFSAEASELRWPPRSWPTRFEINFGNGLPMILRSVNENGAVYEQAAGCITIHVFND